MNLARFPRRRYTAGPTPLERLPRFSAALGGPNVWIKRDDLLGLTAGGNKTRKLEFLVADALARGADTLITCGAIQSNHCRLTLAAAVREGLKCRLVLEERIPGSYDPRAGGNNLLYSLLGAEQLRIVPADASMPAEMAAVEGELAAAGRKGYVIPGGGSTPLGALGYVACAREILAQMFDMGLDLDAVFCASGSAGTQAGLIAGFRGCGADVPVVGISVRRTGEDQEAQVYSLARETAEFAGLSAGIPRESVVCFGDYVGPGYSLPTPGMAEAVKLLARTEGILLDPVYTGKAMAGLMDLVRKGRFERDANLLFVHTGGSPALHAYKEYLFSH
ncbi:MAG TPA: D-cysteine desulfhydrase [Syntrophales bacterium]|nr:D-cysteine desulfhydrase [Syntrophales bacterium]